MSCCSIVELEIVYIKQKLWFRSWWIEQKAYWEKLGPTNQSIMMKCMHNMLLLLFGSPNPQWTIIKTSEASYVCLLFVISWFGRENCYFLPILLFFDLGAKIVTFLKTFLWGLIKNCEELGKNLFYKWKLFPWLLKCLEKEVSTQTRFGDLFQITQPLLENKKQNGEVRKQGKGLKCKQGLKTSKQKEHEHKIWVFHTLNRSNLGCQDLVLVS